MRYILHNTSLYKEGIYSIYTMETKKLIAWNKPKKEKGNGNK